MLWRRDLIIDRAHVWRAVAYSANDGAGLHLEKAILGLEWWWRPALAGAWSLMMSSLGLAAVACAHAAAGSLPCRYEVAHVIQGPPCPFGLQPQTVGTGISPNGRYVCGFWTQCLSGVNEAFVFDTSTSQFTTLMRPAGIVSAQASDVSDAGLIVGTYDRTGVGFRGFVYQMSNAQWTELISANPTGLGWSFANAINSSGTVCGTRSIGSESSTINPQTGFIWSADDGFRDVGLIDGYSTFLDDISDTGLAVGSSGTQFTDRITRGLLFDGQGIQFLPAVPGGSNSLARGVNTDDSILVMGTLEQFPMLFRGFVLKRGIMTQLLLPVQFDRNVGIEITTDGTILGSCSSSAAPSILHPYLWRENEILPIQADLDVGLSFDRTQSISDTGVVVINGRLNNNNVGIVVRPAVPRPGDSNCDLVVNVPDLLDVISSWGPCPSGCSPDFDVNGVVNVHDLMQVIRSWSKTAI